jgi:hypothetical protein
MPLSYVVGEEIVNVVVTTPAESASEPEEMADDVVPFGFVHE